MYTRKKHRRRQGRLPSENGTRALHPQVFAIGRAAPRFAVPTRKAHFWWQLRRACACRAPPLALRRAIGGLSPVRIVTWNTRERGQRYLVPCCCPCCAALPLRGNGASSACAHIECKLAARALTTRARSFRAIQAGAGTAYFHMAPKGSRKRNLGKLNIELAPHVKAARARAIDSAAGAR